MVSAHPEAANGRIPTGSGMDSDGESGHREAGSSMVKGQYDLGRALTLNGSASSTPSAWRAWTGCIIAGVCAGHPRAFSRISGLCLSTCR